jgi:hypothetical protein
LATGNKRGRERVKKIVTEKLDFLKRLLNLVVAKKIKPVDTGLQSRIDYPLQTLAFLVKVLLL